jgi:transcriptional regulator with XRE-family HTH domain
MATIFKLERIKANLKGLEVARKAGLSTSRLSLIENGWVEPTPVEIEKLRRVLPSLNIIRKG